MDMNPAEVAHGPMLIGTFLNLMLYGICVVQLYLYCNSRRRDSLWVQVFVYTLFLADTLHTVFTMVYMYRSLILNFGNYESLATADWIAATDPALTGIIGGAVQIFYIRRLKVLTQNWILVSIVLICACASLLMGLGTAVAVHFIPQYIEFQRFKAATIVWLLGAAVGDVLITAGLVLYLRQQKRGFSKTNSYIDKVVRLTIQTGLLTAIWAIIDCTLYLAIPTGLHLIFNFSLSKLYSNSLMSSLNARDFWRNDDNNFDSGMDSSIPGLGSTSMSTSQGGNVTQLSTLSGLNRATEVIVHVERSSRRSTSDPAKKISFAEYRPEGGGSEVEVFEKPVTLDEEKGSDKV